MLRLTIAGREPRTVTLFDGVTVTHDAVTPAIIQIARAHASRAFLAMMDNAIDANPAAHGAFIAIVGQKVITAWTGVVNEETREAIAPSPDAIEAFFLNPRAFDAFARLVVDPSMQDAGEKNALSRSQNGTSQVAPKVVPTKAAGVGTAQTAPRSAKNALTRKTRHKRTTG